MTLRTDDLRISETRELDPPLVIHRELPLSERAARTTREGREAIRAILDRADDRLLVVVGPCSIHDPEAALEYGERLAGLRRRMGAELLLVMRVYFEKPRTIVGWKGLINDPGLDESFDINRGLRLARRLLLELNERRVPAATEFLDLVTGQYYADLIAWGAIGARTTESQAHRELASGLSCPVGFKNATDGSLKVAIDAVRAAAYPHSFLSPTKEGKAAIFRTTGNRDTHVILRGGREPNYDAGSVDAAATCLARAGLPVRLMIDFSHANARKQHRRQLEVGADVAAQIAAGDHRITGVMIESHLHEGRQEVQAGSTLRYGVSITDPCLGWEQTEALLETLAAAVRSRRRHHAPAGRQEAAGA